MKIDTGLAPMNPSSSASQPDASHHWLLLASGARFHFDGPVTPIAIDDVASALAKLCRFGGAVREFYSVAQHSVHVARHAGEIAAAHGADGRTVALARLVGLLHDAHEMVLADICRPTKWWMHERMHGGALSFGQMLGAAEAVIDDRLRRALGVSIADADLRAVAPFVQAADNLMLAVERRDLMPSTDDVWTGIPTVDDITHVPPLEPLSWRAASAMFVDRWRAVAP